jgi:hypothetical protein
MQNKNTLFAFEEQGIRVDRNFQKKGVKEKKRG